ncbi:MAG: hypothetical protein P8016_16745 [Sedimentisphaerales bacterium]
MAGSRQKLFHTQRFMGAVILAVVLWIEGNVQLIAQPTTQDEARDTLAKLQIRDVPEPNIPMPEIYTREPVIIEQVVSGTPEWKLFYFCKYQPSNELKKIIDEQFSDKKVDPKGKESVTLEYNVSSNPATNQLIVKCPTQEDAQSVLNALNQIDVPPIQVKIDCLISDIYADFTYDRETTIAIENLFGENIALKPGGTPFGADVQELIEDDEYLPAFPGASLRELIRSRMGLKIGYSSTDHEFTALVDMLESRGYLKILMNPTLEIVNGKTAKVQSRQHVPLQKVTKAVPGAGTTTVVLTETEYVDVIDSLEITPHVFADGYIGLETNILLGSKNTGGRPRKEVMAEIYQQHATTSASSSTVEKITDPFGAVARHQEENEKATEVEQDRLEAEAEQRNAQIAVREAQQRVAEAEAELRRLEEEERKVKAKAGSVKVDSDEKGNSQQEGDSEQADKGESGAQANATKSDTVREDAQSGSKTKLQTDRLAASYPQWLGNTLQ